MHKKVLIVGLGGSGGKTLAFLMDELRVRLGEEWEGGLPECWKFVHIDVPVVADALGSNLATPVGAQGGTYVGLANVSTPYENYDTAAMTVLENQNPSALDLAVRWRPDPKRANAIAVSGGAGAYRAVGRVVTVAKAAGIYAALDKAVSDLSSTKANEDLAKLTHKFGTPTGSNQNGEPLVFLVSSLAGGSGASMVLDVADILRGISRSGFDGTHSSAFLYTSEVFASLGISSGGPGSLATISELIGSMNRQDERWNAKEWGALGIGAVSVPTGTGRGPQMIFPVGAKSQGIPFGETPEDVFRGFSRSLAPLFIDENIQNKFDAYVRINAPQQISSAGDNTGLSKDPITGVIKPSHFAGWGSAVLTMGRDRYSEYSAQRVARQAVETLVNGFQDQDFLDQKINLQQAVQRHVDALYPLFVDIAGLSSLLNPLDARSARLMEAIIPIQQRQAFANAKTGQLAPAFNGSTGDITAPNLKNYFSREMNNIKAEANQEVLKTISNWSTNLQKHVEEAFLQISAQRGLRVAVDCLKKLVVDLSAVQGDLEARIAAGQSTIEQGLMSGLQAIQKQGRSPIAMGSSLAQQFLNHYADLLKTHIAIEAAKIVSPVAADFGKNFVGPLIDSANEALKELDTELRKETKAVVTAAYREAPVGQWPKDSREVPSHFEPAVNEVLIDGITQFPAFFDSHVAQAVAPIVSDTVREAGRQVLTRTMLKRHPETNAFENVVGWNWKRTTLDSHPTIDRTRNWQPKELLSVSGETQSQASFSLHLSYKDVLNFARNWVELPSCPFRQHSDQGISEWLSPAAGISDSEKAIRLNKVQTKLSEAIGLASPLVEIDNSAVQAIHVPNTMGNHYTFSSMPFAENHEVVSSLIASWAADPQGAINSTNLKDVCSPGTDKGEIFILGTTASPYLPIVFDSLNKPIRDEWSKAVAQGTTGHFWEWRRARPLRQFLPISKRHLAAFMQGWVVGRITGHIQLDDAKNGSGAKVVRVFDPRDNTWVDFPSNLLGVNGLGISKQATGADESAWNVPAALLESLPLAMAHCQGLDLSPIKPYMAVIQIGLTLKVKPVDAFEPVGAPENVLNPLDEWFTTGGVTGYNPQIASAQGASSEERRLNSKLWLSSVIAYMDELVKLHVNKDNFWGVNREFELAPEVIAAANSVMRELDRSNLGSTIDGVTQVASKTAAPGIPAQTLPAVEG